MPRMTITQLAEQVGVHKSTVSRQVKAAGLMGADKLVDLDEYQTLRRNGLDPALQTTGRAPREPSGDASGDLAIARTRKMEADAALSELELARTRGELVDARAVEAAYEDTYRRLRDRLLIVPREVAGDCARLGDEIAIEGLLSQALKTALADFARGLEETAPNAGGAA